MIDKLEITIDVIVHATEDISKIFQSFYDILEIEEENFSIIETTGYYENPIIMLNAKLVKKQAKSFMEKFLKLLSKNQINQLIEEIEERTIDSKFHFRLDKQELVKGKIELSEKDTVRIKIIALTYRALNTSRKHALRIIARDVINNTVPEMTIDQFVQATVYSKINSDLMAAFKRVIKVRHVGLEKVKLIRTADKETKLLEA